MATVPVYENCNPLDVACVARNLAKENAYNVQVLAEQNAQHLDWCLHSSQYPASDCYATYGPQGSIVQTANAGQPVSGYVPYVPPVVPATTNVSNNMRLGFQTTGYKVGDSWTISISGAPGVGRNVVVTTTKDGKSLGTSNVGKTDSSGAFVLNGRFDSNSVGVWHEEWNVEGTPIGNLDFTVGAIPVVVTQQSVAVPIVGQSQATGLTSQSPTTTTQDTATNASMFDLFGTMDNNIMVPGTNVEVGTYTLAAMVGLLVLGYMMLGKRGRG
jgi:hypothetical protein